MCRTYTIKFCASANLMGADWDDTLEVDAEEWDSLTEDERFRYAEEVMADSTGYEVWYEQAD